MADSYKPPARDDLGFCNVLLSALGGDGANTAGKILFKIGLGEFGLDGGYDARYGSEKKGTPTDVSVRFCAADTPVRQSGPTDRPHFLVVFHDDLIDPLDLGRGLHADATCIVNTTRSPDAVRSLLKLHSGRVVCLDATRIAYDCHSRLNMPLLGMLCHELGFPDEKTRTLIERQWPRQAASNLQAFDRAVSSSMARRFANDDRYPLTSPFIARGPIGWLNMANGGTIDARTHSTAGRDNRVASRGRVPTFAPELCNSCGICMTVCSDPGGLLWLEGRMTGIDERFCKGCMRCVEACPETRRGRALGAPQVF